VALDVETASDRSLRVQFRLSTLRTCHPIFAHTDDPDNLAGTPDAGAQRHVTLVRQWIFEYKRAASIQHFY
jgi:hypothetical protein